SLVFSINGTPLAVGADGLVSTTFDETGTYEIMVTATDPAGNTASRTLVLTVAEPVVAEAEPPHVSISHNAVGEVHPGRSVDFTVTSYHDIPVVSQSLTVNGRAVELDSSGRATILLDAVGDYEIVATAVDADGNIGTHRIVLSVVREVDRSDMEKPTVSLSHTATKTMREGDSAVFTVTATDNNRVEKTTLTVNGVDIPLDANGTATYVFAAVGTYVVVAKAFDAAGNEAVTTSLITVAAPADTQRPTVKITASNSGIWKVGEKIDFHVVCEDNVGVVRMQLVV
ncbi:MAG: hypothetical protein LUG50_00960, partial [Planctomycetaceae bacterium]|nr:hypothetical protein [Planctomycetaceae bacterium]